MLLCTCRLHGERNFSKHDVSYYKICNTSRTKAHVERERERERERKRERERERLTIWYTLHLSHCQPLELSQLFSPEIVLQKLTEKVVL